MRLLTDEEFNQCCKVRNLDAICRAVEAAVIKKLAAGVDVEPSAWTHKSWLSNPHAGHFMANKTASFDTPLYTAEAIASARINALEEAAMAIEERGRMTKNGEWHGNSHAAQAFAECIRQLVNAEVSGGTSATNAMLNGKT